jgi:hypothetical protein
MVRAVIIAYNGKEIDQVKSIYVPISKFINRLLTTEKEMERRCRGLFQDTISEIEVTYKRKFGPRFEHGISRNRSKCVNHYTVTFCKQNYGREDGHSSGGGEVKVNLPLCFN